MLSPQGQRTIVKSTTLNSSLLPVYLPFCVERISNIFHLERLGFLDVVSTYWTTFSASHFLDDNIWIITYSTTFSLPLSVTLLLCCCCVDNILTYMFSLDVVTIPNMISLLNDVTLFNTINHKN